MAKTASNVKKVKGKLQVAEKKMAALQKDAQQKVKKLAAELKAKVAAAEAKAYAQGMADATKEIRAKEQARAKLMAEVEKKLANLFAGKSKKQAKAVKVVKVAKVAKAEAAPKAVKSKGPKVAKLKSVASGDKAASKLQQRGRPRKEKVSLVVVNEPSLEMPSVITNEHEHS